MSKAKSDLGLPGFTAVASLEGPEIHYYITGRRDLVTSIDGLVIPKLQGIDPENCQLWGDQLICSIEPGSEIGIGIGGGGIGGGIAKSTCISGDRKKVCNCPKNCFSSDTQCWCISYPPA